MVGSFLLLSFYHVTKRPILKRVTARIVSSTRRPRNGRQFKRRGNRTLPTDGRIELDSHADTVVLGSNAVVLHYTGNECEVSPYSDEYEAISNVPVARGANLWTDKNDNQGYILVFNEALWMGGTLPHSLINPNQLRAYGTLVQDNPFSRDPLAIEPPNNDITIPLSTLGTIIYADTRAPTQEELATLPHVVLSADSPWDPHRIQFPSRDMEAVKINATKTHERSQLFDNVEPGLQGTVHDPSTLVTLSISSIQVHNPTVTKYDLPMARTFHSAERKQNVSTADISERWFIGLQQAANTIKATTQRLLRSAILPLARRYRADRMYERPRFRGVIYTDTLNGKVTSLDGNKYAQVFVTSDFFATVYPMDTKAKAGDALKEFITDFGVPDKVVMDGASEQTGRKTTFMQQLRKHHIDFHITEPERYNQSKAEGVIREIRKKWFWVMTKSAVPKRLWDYGLRWVVEIMQRTASDTGDLRGRTSLEKVTGETPEISEYVDFGFYDYCWYRENAGMGETKLGRWLGVSHKTGSLMSFWILTDKCRVVSRTSVQRMTELEKQEQSVASRLKAFHDTIKLTIRDSAHVLEEGGKNDPYDWSNHPFDDDPDFQEEFNEVVSNPGIADADDTFTPDTYDTYLQMELALPQGDSLEPRLAKVTKRMKDANGIPIGTAHDNPLLDTRMYEVEYVDGEKAALSANHIEENLFAQVDDEGNCHVLMHEIINHRMNGQEVKQQDAFLTTKMGTKRRRETTKGWELLFEWKDGSTTWVALKDMKESFPVQVSEYAVASRIAMQPAFAW